MALSTMCSLITEPIKAKRLADQGTGCRFGVSVRTIRVSAVTPCIMQTVGHALRGSFMGKIAALAAGTLAILEKVSTDGHLGWIVLVSTRRAFVARTYKKNVSLFRPNATYRAFLLDSFRQGLSDFVEERDYGKKLPYITGRGERFARLRLFVDSGSTAHSQHGHRHWRGDVPLCLDDSVCHKVPCLCPMEPHSGHYSRLRCR